MLPVANVHQVMQDSKGYIWYATLGGGLCRDNGYQIDRFFETGDVELSSCSVFKVVENIDGKIWAATNVGLCWLDPLDSYSLHKVSAQTFASSHISSVVATHDGHIWASCSNCVACFDRNAKLLKKYPLSNKGDGTKTINDIFEDSSHKLWLLECRRGIMLFDKQKDAFKRVSWTFAEPIEMVEDQRHQCYWIATWGGGIVRHTFSGKTTCSTPNMPFNIGICLTSDGQQLLMSDMDQLHLFDIIEDGQLNENNDIQHLLPNGKNILDKITLDKDGSIWVASFSPHTFILSKHNTVESPQTQILQKLADDMLAVTNSRILPCNIVLENDGMWLWQSRIGLTYYSPKLGLMTCPGTVAPGSDSNMKRCFKNDGVWTLADNNLLHTWLSDGKPHTETFLSLPAGEHLTDICDLGKDIWLATPHNIYHWDGRKTSKYAEETECIVALRVDSQGHPKPITTNTTDNFTCVTVSSDGTSWMGNSQGFIYRQRSSDAKPQKIFEAVHNERLNHICYDASGHIWTISDHTLCEYSPSTNAARIVNSSSLTPNIEFYRSLCATEGGMYVGASGGLMYTPTLTSLDQEPQQICPLVSTVLVDGRLTDSAAKHVNITAGKHLLEIRLTTLQYANADKIYFSYRIHELSNEWILLPQGQNELRLLLPSPGSYTLEVKATDVNGIWGRPFKVLSLYKQPHWWETWWAYLIYLVSALTIIVICVFIYVRNQHREMEWKRQEEVLRLRINHLLEQVETTISSTPTNEESNKPADQQTASNPSNDEFIQKVVACIEEHLGEEYSVEQLASDLCMERTSLYKKLTSIIDQTPQKFIRTIRIRRACELLSTTSLSITDICYRVGFSTSSYMSRCFVEDLGCKPSEWREKQQVST